MEPSAHRLHTLLLFAVTLILIAPAHAGSISGTFDGNATLTPTGTTGVYIQNFSGDGTDNTYGDFAVTSMSTVDFSNPPNITFTDGMLLETFGGGTLFGTGSGTGMGNGHGMATFTIDFVITGGTGIFFGEHGSAMITGDITQTGPLTEAISNASYTGTLVTPEPSSLGLIVLGASMGYRFLVKGRSV
ncbi:MAG: hypothetical protein WBS19_02120 [Candidatus Korobacteraceae bacterium]